MVCDMHLPAVVVYSGWQDLYYPSMQEHFL